MAIDATAGTQPQTAGVARGWPARAFAVVLGGLLCISLAACGSGGAAAPAGPALPAAGTARDPQPSLLLARLGLAPGAAAPVQPRQVRAQEFRLDGSQYAAWSGAPSAAPAPGDSRALRLVTTVDHPLAYAAYRLPAQGTDYNGLPRRLTIEITPALASAGAALQPLEYYVGVSNYTDSAWDWLGPFHTAYAPLINSDSQRSRFFDLDGATLIVVALTNNAGQARCADIRSVGFSTAGAFFPVKPYRPSLSPANVYWGGGGPGAGPDGLQPAGWTTISLAKGSAYPDPSPFQIYGFDSADVLRREQGAQEWELLGTAPADLDMHGSLHFADPNSVISGAAHPRPGGQYDYALRLRNARGTAPPTDPVPVTVVFAPPVFTLVQPSLDAISLAWTTPVDLTGQELYRNGELLAGLPPTQTSYLDATAEPGVEYSYSVRALSPYGQRDSTAAVAVRWPYPAYRLTEGPADGQVIDLSGRLAVLVAASSGADCALSMLEADQADPGPEDWHAVSHGLAGLEQGRQADSYSWQGTSSIANFCNMLGQPVCLMDTEMASSDRFELAVAYRPVPPPPQGGGGHGDPPPLVPPYTLPWNDSHVRVGGLVDDFSVCTVDNRLAVAWRDETTSNISYAAALVGEPQASTDWKVCPVTTTWAAGASVASVGNLPALLVDGIEGLDYYRCENTEPYTPSNWTKINVAPRGTTPLLTTVGATPFATYIANGKLNFARTPTSLPLPGAWTVGTIASGTTTAARIADINGKAAVVFVRHDADAATPDGTLWLALAKTFFPVTEQDWQLTELDACGSTQLPGIALSAGKLYVTYRVEGHGLREEGEYLALVAP
jgi:hypothetical protein